MRRQRCVKVLATLGPSSNDYDQIKSLYDCGADCFRINMSHAPIDEMNRLVSVIRQIEHDVSRPISILVDLQGPKYRVGEFEKESASLANGSQFSLMKEKLPGTSEAVHLPHPEVFDAIKEGHELLLDDGKLKLKVTSVTKTHIHTSVIVGGVLKSRKGVSFPDTVLPIGALTDIDRKNLKAAVAAKADWIALSFVQRPSDVEEAIKLCKGKVGILSKIEKPSAVQDIEEIIELSDAIMVARGDLGVEMPVYKVPGVQKRLVRMAQRAGKPVVVATQMLESMITSPVPTRAEVSDVATAVFEGADAIMLSAESAAGDFPNEAVSMMNSIAESIEKDPLHRQILTSQQAEPEATGADAISQAARSVAETLGLNAIVCYTSSGGTGMRMARERPQTPILAMTPCIHAARRLTLVWGLHTVVTSDAISETDMVEKACKAVTEGGFASPGERIIITAGVPFGTPGTTNLLRIAYIGG